MRRLLFALSLLLVAVCSLHITSTASAEMLLAEISYTTPQPVAAPASFGFGVGNHFIAPPTFHNWIEIVPSFPYTTTADPANVAAFDRLLTTFVHEGGVDFGFRNGPYELPSPELANLSLDRAFEGDYVEFGVTATRYAPPIGETHPFQWYALSAIERSVTSTMQTIRIYGFAVPEPATCLIAILGSLLCVSTWRSCSARGRRRRSYHKR
jgi:hypothetical protein